MLVVDRTETLKQQPFLEQTVKDVLNTVCENMKEKLYSEGSSDFKSSPARCKKAILLLIDSCTSCLVWIKFEYNKQPDNSDAMKYIDKLYSDN